MSCVSVQSLNERFTLKVFVLEENQGLRTSVRSPFWSLDCLVLWSWELFRDRTNTKCTLTPEISRALQYISFLEHNFPLYLAGNTFSFIRKLSAIAIRRTPINTIKKDTKDSFLGTHIGELQRFFLKATIFNFHAIDVYNFIAHKKLTIDICIQH